MWHVHAGDVAVTELQTFAMATFPDIITHVADSKTMNAYLSSDCDP